MPISNYNFQFELAFAYFLDDFASKLVNQFMKMGTFQSLVFQKLLKSNWCFEICQINFGTVLTFFQYEVNAHFPI